MQTSVITEEEKSVNHRLFTYVNLLKHLFETKYNTKLHRYHKHCPACLVWEKQQYYTMITEELKISINCEKAYC